MKIPAERLAVAYIAAPDLAAIERPDLEMVGLVRSDLGNFDLGNFALAPLGLGIAARHALARKLGLGLGLATAPAPAQVEVEVEVELGVGEIAGLNFDERVRPKLAGKLGVAAVQRLAVEVLYLAGIEAAELFLDEAEAAALCLEEVEVEGPTVRQQLARCEICFAVPSSSCFQRGGLTSFAERYVQALPVAQSYGPKLSARRRRFADAAPLGYRHEWCSCSLARREKKTRPQTGFRRK